MRLRCAVFHIIFLLTIIPSRAQYLELGIYGGVSNYQGDLAPVAFVPKETHLAGGGFMKYNFNKFFAVKASIYSGTISGDDANSKDRWNNLRNLSFKSNVSEISVFGEMNVAGFNPHYRDHLFSPYIFIGIGLYHFDPMAYYQGQWYHLQPLSTEGQGLKEYPDRHPYKLTQMSIPMGLGFKGSISRHLNVGLELGWRKTFTDYLDDVSKTYVSKEILVAEKGDLSWQLSNRTDEVNGGTEVLKDDTKYRGDPTDLDWYIFSGFIVSYNFDLLSWDQKKYKFKHKGDFKGLRRSKKAADCPDLTK